ncbi:Organic Anion Transporter Polypeptide (OATP) family [Popillia japonica]|uniref:Organic Anion Transporter Polypeptide (OATP) family n=1 Tax=Popillia japonica TaxID=7064 RepID=A0AAW1IBZ4_POPJA
MWTTPPQSEKISNNNKSTNGNTAGVGGDVSEERTALTEQNDSVKSQCFTVATDCDFCDDSDTECGLGPCAPSWLQKFASKQIFLLVFCIAWVLQGMYHTYFVSAITTIEKLFQIQSKITGIIMSATEIGQIGSSLLLTYYGGQGHRPKWIAWGMVLFAVSSFTCSLPHFIYGRQIMNSNDLAGISKDTDTSSISEPRIEPTVTKIVLAIFFISLLGVGMGQTAVYTLGIPYMDDNVASKESPLYFAITIGIRILGPALGFIVGSLCTSLYADLSVDPKIDTNDPRWVGAWWLGLVLISGLLMLTSFAMFAFPKRLSTGRPAPRLQRTGRKHPSIRGKLFVDVLFYKKNRTVNICNDYVISNELTDLQY